MNSLTTHYRRSQLIALPVPGGKAKVEYCYAVNVPGGRVIVTHSFAEWAVGDFNRQKETVLCDKLTAGSKITTEYPSESFVGSRKHNGLLMNDDYRSLYSVIVDRYRLRKSKLQMANELQAKHPDWPLITCRRRIDTWLSLAESILYAPVCDAFGTNSDRFKLQSEQESA